MCKWILHDIAVTLQECRGSPQILNVKQDGVHVQQIH